MNAPAPRPVSAGELYVSNVIASFFYGFQPFVSKPTPQQPQARSTFVSHFILESNHPDLPRIAAKIEQVGLAKWGDQWPIIREQLKGQDKLCLHKGDISKAGKAEYAGKFYISGSGPSLGRSRFGMFDRDGVTPLQESDDKLYSGAKVNAKLDIWAQDSAAGGKRINCTITGVQHVDHGPRFTSGARAAAPGEFGNIAGADAAPPAAGDSSSILS